MCLPPALPVRRPNRRPVVQRDPPAPRDHARGRLSPVTGGPFDDLPAGSATEPVSGSDGKMSENLLEATGVQKHFPITKGLFRRQVGAVRAVDGIDVRIRTGETLGLVGESGSGKPTAGRLFTRILEPTAGTITFEGEDISHKSVSQMRPFRRDVQMIFQDPYSSLNPRHTVGTIISAPLQIQDIPTPQGLKKAVQDLLKLVGLNPEHYNRYPHEFSGGQRQRIGIARALALAAQADRARRAGLGARRVDPGPGRQPARRPAARVRPDLRLHRPRP